MAHTYTSLTYHVVFSTKQRRPLIDPALLPRLAKFVGGVIRQRKSKLLAMGGTTDHVHILGTFAPKMAVSDQMRDVKALSSGWIKDNDGEKSFAWQEGYSAFSVGTTGLDSVRRYIDNQQAHHRKTTFDEELLALLQRANIEYDPKHVFG
jgi:REP element-mobilizing transposase RayT